jgi:ABC-2 type transport system ATP-binding protein
MHDPSADEQPHRPPAADGPSATSGTRPAEGASDLAIDARGLVKRYGDLRALDGVDLQVARGTVQGLLGPNGAGKTTAVRSLATLLRLDDGRAEVAGHDVRRDPDAVRARIGLTGQYAAVDELLSGRQNLVMFGRLLHLGRAGARRRADVLLERFALTDAADRPVRSYSGGMRRRLDLAASLVLAPEVLFLDEPTTGLDPRSRIGVWDAVRSLVADGTTVLLTTQYLEEADQLADQIAVIDHGRIIAEGTADELKRRTGGDQLEVALREDDDLEVAASVVAQACEAPVDVSVAPPRVTVPVRDRVAAMTAVVRELDAAGIVPDDLALRRPTLDDVFLQLTGRRTDADPTTDPDAPGVTQEVAA